MKLAESSPKGVENTVGKGEIALSNFSVNINSFKFGPIQNFVYWNTHSGVLLTSGRKTFENILEKGEIASDHHFVLLIIILSVVL